MSRADFLRIKRFGDFYLQKLNGEVTPKQDAFFQRKAFESVQRDIIQLFLRAAQQSEVDQILGPSKNKQERLKKLCKVLLSQKTGFNYILLNESLTLRESDFFEALVEASKGMDLQYEVQLNGKDLELSRDGKEYLSSNLACDVAEKFIFDWLSPKAFHRGLESIKNPKSDKLKKEFLMRKFVEASSIKDWCNFPEDEIIQKIKEVGKSPFCEKLGKIRAVPVDSAVAKDVQTGQYQLFYPIESVTGYLFQDVKPQFLDLLYKKFVEFSDVLNPSEELIKSAFAAKVFDCLCKARLPQEHKVETGVSEEFIQSLKSSLKKSLGKRENIQNKYGIGNNNDVVQEFASWVEMQYERDLLLKATNHINSNQRKKPAAI